MQYNRRPQPCPLPAPRVWLIMDLCILDLFLRLLCVWWVILILPLIPFSDALITLSLNEQTYMPFSEVLNLKAVYQLYLLNACSSIHLGLVMAQTAVHRRESGTCFMLYCYSTATAWASCERLVRLDKTFEAEDHSGRRDHIMVGFLL